MHGIYEQCIRVGIEEGWHQTLAKKEQTGATSLLAHVLNVMSVAESVMEMLGKFSNNDKLKVLAACFIHDSGKLSEEVQQKLAGERKGMFKHKGSDIASTEEKKTILSKIGIPTNSQDEIISMDRVMESIESSTHKTDILSGAATQEKLWRTVQLADQLVSRKQLSNLDLTQEGTLMMTLRRLGLSIDYHKISTIRGILTQLLHKALSKAYENKGWKPILYYPDGTVYLSKQANRPNFTEEHLTHMISRTTEEFIKNIDSVMLGNAVFGNIRTTVIKTPEFLFFNEDTIRAFWRYIAIQKFVTTPLPPSDKVPIYKKLLKLRDNEEESIFMLRFKKRRSVAYLFHIMKEIVKLAAEYESDKAWLIFEEEIQNNKKNSQLVSMIKRIASTSKPQEVVSLYEILLECKVIRDEKLEDIHTKLFALFTKITLRLWKEVVSKKSSSLLEYANRLLQDIEKPMLFDIRSISDSIFTNYSSGKNKGAIFCSLCGGVPENVASEPLVGEGVESFQNAIKGGSNLGGKNKAKLCMLCEMEAKLRSIFVSNNADVILVLPQLNLGSTMRIKWQEIIQKLFLGLQTFGMRPVNERYWYDMVIHAQISDSSLKILQDIKESPKNKKEIINNYIQFLENTYENITEFKEREKIKVPCNNFQELAEMIYDSTVKLPKDLSKELELELIVSTKTHASYESPNYLLISLGNPIGRRDESETSAIIRKVFVGLLIARLFLASAIFPDTSLGVYYHIETPKGYLRLPMKLGLYDFYKKLGTYGWVHTNQMDQVLRRLAIYLKTESILFASKSDFGRDTLLQTVKKLPGEVLNRNLQITGEPNRTLYSYLNELLM